MRRIVLTTKQMLAAQSVGVRRLEEAPGQPRFSYQSTKSSGRSTHIVGAQAEYAFATSLGLPWPGRVNTFRTLPDVDPNWEVRWTSGNKIKVATDDDPGILVAMVIGRPPVFDIVGYVVAGAIQQRFPAADLGDRGWAAHFASFELLAPINEDFHDLHAWGKDREGFWWCAFCGAAFE